MVEKSLVLENIQKNRYDITMSEGVETLYPVVKDLENQPVCLEQIIIDYIMKYKNMLRIDRDSYNYNTFLASFTSTVELSVKADSESRVSIRTLDRCEYYSKHYNYITSMKCSDFHRMLAMMTESSTSIISSSRLYSVVMRQGAFQKVLDKETMMGFLQVYDAMLFAVIKRQHDNPSEQKYSYTVYKDILGLCHRMAEFYGSDNPLVGYVRYSLETLRRSLLDEDYKDKM